MQFQLPRLMVIAVAALLAPSAAATWYSFGTYEPDNADDTNAYMWEDAPPAGEARIYFNAYTGTAPGLRALLINPNVGALETSNEVTTLEYHMAMLGVWIDCNGDNYVGLAETASREYPADLLLDDSACPGITGDINNWTVGAHNYNGWVSEYVAIGGITTDPLDDMNDTRIYRDPAAMVWGDNGRPDDPATAGGSCALAPQPRGTYQSTGGALNYADCATGLMERWNDLFLGRRLAGNDIPGLYSFGVPDLGLTFEDTNDARGSWMDVGTFGSEDTQYSPAHVWDCSAEPIAHSGDTYNATPAGGVQPVPTAVSNTSVYALDPRTGNTNPGEATIPALTNDTLEGATGDCDTSNDAGHDFYGAKGGYVGEADFNGVSVANKRAAAWNLQFQDSSRGGDPTSANIPNGGGPLPESPVYGGNAGMAPPTFAISNWNSPAVLVKLGPGLVRTDINEGSATIAPAQRFTFYAHVGATTKLLGFALPGGPLATGEYAVAQCGSVDTGIVNGWNCDVAEWYLNADGTPIPELTPFARPGQTYQLRDVDCHDGRNSLNVPLGAPAYGDDPCV